MAIQSDVDICNLAQDLLGAEALASIDAPRSANEKRYARNYPVIRDAELRKRRWNFAKELAIMTPVGTPMYDGRNTYYRYNLPGDCIRPIRQGVDDWISKGAQLLWTTSGTLRVWYTARKAAALMDPLFQQMLAAALAMELCEAVTQSNEKKADAANKYELVRREAGSANAFEIGPEKIADDDSAFDWVQSRYA